MGWSSSQKDKEKRLKPGGPLGTEVTGLADGVTAGKGGKGGNQDDAWAVGLSSRGSCAGSERGDEEPWVGGRQRVRRADRNQELLADMLVWGAHWATLGKCQVGGWSMGLWSSEQAGLGAEMWASPITDQEDDGGPCVPEGCSGGPGPEVALPLILQA